VDEYYGDGYLLLNQCEQSNNKPYYDGEALSLERISEIIDKADKIGVEVTLIADACRSGSVLSAEANKMMSGININTTTMISCQHNEYSEESIKYGNGHGVFTYYLIQGMMGLADSNKDLKISLLELQTYVQTKVVTEREGQQTPVFTGKLMKEIAPVNEKLLAENLSTENDLNNRIITLSKLIITKVDSINKLLGTINDDNYHTAIKEVRSEFLNIQNAVSDAQPQLADKLLEDYSDIQIDFPEISLLSITEKRIFVLSVNGYPTKEIAGLLGLTSQYVNNARTNIRKKMGIEENWKEVLLNKKNPNLRSSE
jgi:hypothetical protein